MTDCPNGAVRDLLPDLLHDRLAPDVRRTVEAHLRVCAACQDELALLRRASAMLRRVPAVDAGAIAAAIPAYRAPARRTWGGWQAAAAVIILAAGGASVTMVQRASRAPADSLTSSQVAIEASRSSSAPAAASRELALGSSAISDLSDRELSALLKELPTLDVLPSVDVDTTAAISPVAPTGTE